MNTHTSDRGNEPVAWNQFHTFANQMDTNFSIVNSRIHETHREILEVRLVPEKIAGWVAGAMIGSSSVIFGGFQLLRGFL